MGEMSDYYLDIMFEAEAQRADEVRAWLELSDEELKKEIKNRKFYKSDYTKMVRDIVKVELPLTKKQRKALALYLVNDYRT